MVSRNRFLYTFGNDRLAGLEKNIVRANLVVALVSDDDVHQGLDGGLRRYGIEREFERGRNSSIELHGTYLYKFCVCDNKLSGTQESYKSTKSCWRETSEC